MQKETKQFIRELLELAFDAMDKTDACVSVDVSNYGIPACVHIMNDGFDFKKEYDGVYYLGLGDCQEKEFQDAKRHLESLLNKKEVGSNETREESKD